MQIPAFYVCYFKFTYFLLCAPFYISKCKSKSASSVSFIQVQWWPQRLATFLFLLLTSFWIYIGATVSSFQTDSAVPPSKNPTLLFHTGWRILNSLGILVQIKILWLDRAKFAKMLNLISDKLSENSFSVPTIRFCKLNISPCFCAILICTLHTLVAILDTLFGKGLVGLPKASSRQAVITGNTSEIGSMMTNNINDLSSWDLFCYVILNVGWFHRYVISQFYIGNAFDCILLFKLVYAASSIF